MLKQQATRGKKLKLKFIAAIENCNYEWEVEDIGVASSLEVEYV